MRVAIFLTVAGAVSASAGYANDHRIGMAGMAYAPAIVEAKAGRYAHFRE